VHLLTLPPLSLYVHIPWCVRKCPYCDFNSHETKSIPEQAYLAILKQDLQIDSVGAQGRKLSSIFFGGGTPSLFSAKTIASILDEAERCIGFENDIEITLEANPGTFEQKKFTDFFAAGINRLSIGIQSFSASHLIALGRIHDRDEALRALTMAQQAGFNNINIDLMHGLPQQDLKQACDDIATALSFSPTHISWYQLTIEPNTAFYRQPPPLPADEQLADIQEAGFALLDQHHYQHYEVSAFSLPGRQSKHNRNYWAFGDYIGVGAGAHSKQTSLEQQRVIRRQKTRQPDHYLTLHHSTEGNQGPRFKEHFIDIKELPLEFMMNALRLKKGVPIEYFSQRTGLAFSVVETTVRRLQRQGLLIDNERDIATTTLGQQFLNTVLEAFMPET